MEKTRRPDDIPWRVIRARFTGSCRLCRRTLFAGERVQWHPTFGARCWDGGVGEVVCMAGDDDDLRWDGL